MALFVATLLLACSSTTVVSISLADSTSTSNQNLLPASRLVDLRLYDVDGSHRVQFEQTHQPSSIKDKSASFSSLLKRRDGLSIYGKNIVHEPEEPNYATLSLLPMTDGKDDIRDCGWEATMLLTPSSNEYKNSLDNSCFAAMNRFAVKEGCEYLFEHRWAERESKLPQQPGFLSFCLLRKRDTPENHALTSIRAPFNYSSLTLWASFDAWTSWRNGDGRYSHDASRAAKRTPVQEWLEYPASPIFWDGLGTIMTESGV